MGATTTTSMESASPVTAQILHATPQIPGPSRSKGIPGNELIGQVTGRGGVGLDGLSEEELREIEDDPDADMDDEE